MFGAEAHGGDLDGDAADEILTGNGPDPAAVGRARAFAYDGAVTPMPSIDLMPYTTAYGIHAAATPIGW